ncbi:NAD(P)H:quinone oxidoreductase type IV [Sulfitobacter sp. F26169L]|uniref:NAD(P)H:quinone oxidoreductase type IV n=1 Tax=Sulfitobacter sp. F26169L TaxID=2996015 RepID=UPI002260D10E|nr:NAD(P)H:quinone oxidoreductase type IV [Sulfitobacter sp. F26169L]MCX7565013.1 NAD(P)H:quinone oxidoreductase type IV [Sulfitobacter sp. F26169L]
MTVKLAIVYYSSYGTNYKMATIAAEAAKAAGAEVRLLKAAETAPDAAVNSQDAWKAHAEATKDIPEATAEDMEWANAYIISAGTRFGVMASQMRAFIDTLGGVWGKGGLANKPVTAMTSAQNAHGGQETTLQSFYTTVMHWGGFVVAPGYTDEVIFKTGGNPYGYSHTQGAEFTDEVKSAISHQARRLVETAAKLA